jgi:hypothetical protein
MKALFEISPSFKSIIDISHPNDIYYFAVIEGETNPHWTLLDGYRCSYPSTTRKLAFRLFDYISININDEFVYIPHYIFYRME